MKPSWALAFVPVSEVPECFSDSVFGVNHWPFSHGKWLGLKFEHFVGDIFTIHVEVIIALGRQL